MAAALVLSMVPPSRFAAAGKAPAWLPFDPLRALGAYALPGLLSGLAVLCALALALGKWDRLAACLALWFAFSLGSSPEALSLPAMVALATALTVHLALPAAPYGSLAAVGRVDPRGGWSFPGVLFALVWTSLGLFHAWVGLALLAEGLRSGAPSGLDQARVAGHLLFGPLALWKRTRGLALGLGVVVEAAGGFSGGRFVGTLPLHLLAWDPAWVPARSFAGERLYYDGACGLCHRSVRLLLAEDRSGELRFAALGGQTFEREVPAKGRAGLPDSIVLQRADGSLLVEARAALHLGRGLGGLWALASAVAGLLPPALLDRLYRLVARSRRRLFARPTESCPLLPEDLRQRFD